MNGHIPEKVWRKKVVLGILKFFGCPTYAHVKVIKRSKLDLKYQKMIFIRYL